MLPQGKSTRCDEDPCKFADTAVRCIMEKFDALEIPRKEIVCKLFGGGFTVKDKANLDVRSIVDVGKKNVAVAKAELARYGLKPSVDESRGKSGRKLFFVTSTGDVWMRFVGNEENLSSCF